MDVVNEQLNVYVFVTLISTLSIMEPPIFFFITYCRRQPGIEVNREKEIQFVLLPEKLPPQRSREKIESTVLKPERAKCLLFAVTLLLPMS